MNVKLTTPQYTFLVFTILLIIYWFSLYITTTTEGFHNFFYSFLFGLTPLIGGIIAVFNAKIWGGMKTLIGRSIFFIGFGMFLWGGGEMIWSYYNFFLEVPAPYPSLADVGFAPSIFFYGLGVLLLSRVTGAQLGLKSNLAKFFVVITAIIVVPFSWYILVTLARGGVLIPPGETPLKIVLDIAYPLGSLFALAIATIISGLSFRYMGGRYTLSIVSLLVGLFVMFIGDTLFSYTTTVGTYYNANFGDLILLLGTFLLTFGVLGFYRYKEPVQKIKGHDPERLYNKIASNIIKEQENIMGPVAISEASKVSGITIASDGVNVSEDVDGMVVLDNLVKQYEDLFGPTAVDVCRRATKVILADIPSAKIPDSLK